MVQKIGSAKVWQIKRQTAQEWGIYIDTDEKNILLQSDEHCIHSPNSRGGGWYAGKIESHDYFAPTYAELCGILTQEGIMPPTYKEIVEGLGKVKQK